MRHSRLLVAGLAALTLFPCAYGDDKIATRTAPLDATSAVKKPPAVDPAGTGLRLVYTEEAPGIEPTTVRVTITSTHMRLDDNNGADGFVLFDRKAGIIYSIADEERSIVVVSPRVGGGSSVSEHGLREVRIEDPDLPVVGGVQARRYQYLIEDRVCMDVVTVEGFLPEAATAYREFRSRLADENRATAEQLPVELHDACDLAVNVYEPNRHIEHGFPVIEIDHTGRTRVLLDYDSAYAVEPGSFLLPDGYSRQTLQELRER